MRGFFLAASLLAAGCAPMSESACRSANWYELGELEALVYGLRPQIDQYAYQCAKYGVQASEKDYMAGWIDGYREFIRRSRLHEQHHRGCDCRDRSRRREPERPAHGLSLIHI